MGKKHMVMVILLWITIFCITGMAEAAEIKSSDISTKPTTFAKVKTEPSSALLGHWQCTHPRYDLKTGVKSPETVEYWLVKYNDKYGIYFYRPKAGVKTYRGWRNWYIDGDKINSGAEITIFTENGEVFYQWRDDKPTKMTRIEETR